MSDRESPPALFDAMAKDPQAFGVALSTMIANPQPNSLPGIYKMNRMLSGIYDFIWSGLQVGEMLMVHSYGTMEEGLGASKRFAIAPNRKVILCSNPYAVDAVVPMSALLIDMQGALRTMIATSVKTVEQDDMQAVHDLLDHFLAKCPMADFGPAGTPAPAIHDTMTFLFAPPLEAS